MKKILLVLLFLFIPSILFSDTLHVLEGNDKGEYKVVTHQAVPGGNNSVGKTWKSCLLAANDPVLNSILTVGTAPGNITQVEVDSIAAGDVMEIVTTIMADTNAARTEMVNTNINNKLAELQRKYKFYGFVQN